jgi:hypothetical protein
MKSWRNRKPGEDLPKRGKHPDSERAGTVSCLRCPNCGQNIFVTAEDEPPEICQYCNDMTTWQVLQG